MIFKYYSIYQSNALSRNRGRWELHNMGIDTLPRYWKGSLTYSAVYREKTMARCRYEIDSNGHLKDYRWAPTKYEKQLNLKSNIEKPYNYKYNRFL